MTRAAERKKPAVDELRLSIDGRWRVRTAENTAFAL